MSLLHKAAPYPHWEFTVAHGVDRLRLVPERGGLLTGWRCNGRELLYLDQQRFADPTASVRGGMPVLFPICGNLPDDRLRLPEGDFALKQHGFARDLPWKLQELADGSGVGLSLVDTAATRAQFPFAFRLDLELRLEPSALAITVVVANPGERPLPFAFGLHPYFAVSSLAAAALEGLPERCLNHHSMQASGTAAQLARLEQGVDLLAAPAGAVRLRDREAGFALELQPTAPFDLAVVWTDPPRAMVCLEPWTAPRGALANGERRLELAPGADCRLSALYRLIQD